MGNHLGHLRIQGIPSGEQGEETALYKEINVIILYWALNAPGSLQWRKKIDIMLLPVKTDLATFKTCSSHNSNKWARQEQLELNGLCSVPRPWHYFKGF